MAVPDSCPRSVADLQRGYLLAWEIFGLVFCLCLSLGSIWWSRHTMEVRSPEVSRTTVASSEAVRCRVGWILDEDDWVMEGTSVPGENKSDPCRSRSFVPVPDDTLLTEAFVHRLEGYLKGTPMEALIASFRRYDRRAVAFAVGIAKKESDWGRLAPKILSEDCFNYWGYKGAGGRGSVGGYACFSSPDEAVDTVVGRISDLVYRDKRDTPAKMVVWKCGSSCAWDNPENVNRWVNDVARYYHELVG